VFDWIADIIELKSMLPQGIISRFQLVVVDEEPRLMKG
jgi:hypothetical protein